MKLLTLLSDFILPPKCLFCGSSLEAGTRPLICKTCFSKHGVNHSKCCRCGSDFEYRNGLPYCNTCRSCRHPFDGVVSCFYYSEGVRRSIVEHKFNFEYNNAQTLSTVLANKVKSVFSEDMPDFVIPVPNSKKRLFQRGFDPLLEIAEEFSIETGVPLVSGTIIKHKHIPQQSTLLTFRQRLKNVRGCFKLLDKTKVNNAKILLIDDVYTTGATTRECAKILKRGGASYIMIATVAISENFRRW